MPPPIPTGQRHLSVCLSLMQSIARSSTVEEMYDHALDALEEAMGFTRAAILLFDDDVVMRFKAWRGLSDKYRKAVEGHTPWNPESPNPEPILVADVASDPSLAPFLSTIQGEGIGALSFIPLVYSGKVIGKFMLYRNEPGSLAAEDLLCAQLIASEIAFAVVRTRAESKASRSESRLRFALDAASMGTWEWDVEAGTVRWSDNLEEIHGLPAGTFSDTFESYAKEIHPDDREGVMAAVSRTLRDGMPYEVEYRLVAPDGTVRWAEGKGNAEMGPNGAARMTGVCMIVTRRKEAELAKLAAAEEASRLKDEFLAVLSHELRTPLNAILGWVQMLDTGNLSPERVRQAISVIGRNATLQAQLIEDILDVSRIITDKLEVEHHPLQVSQLIDHVVSAALPAAEAKRITLSHKLPDCTHHIDGDLRRLQQVMSNIMSNAVRFTPEGGTIHIECHVVDDEVEVRVTDSGEGISAEFLPYVFDRFRQADSRSTRRHGGLGLGLAIARYLVEQHQGRISADSGGPGKGTTVRVVLPLMTSPVPSQGGEPGTDQAVELRMDGVRVLVVDDHEDSRDLVAELCEQCGALVTRCDSAAAALKALSEAPAGLLVADIAMPDMDGYALIRQTRQIQPTVPAIAVSAYVREEDRVRALSAGFNAYCVKPLDSAAFLKAIQAVL